MVELLVHGREVTLEQQKAVHARVIWYVPCTCTRYEPNFVFQSSAELFGELGSGFTT